MRTIINIAKKELKSLFFSPIAWCVLILFTLSAGFMFMMNLGNYIPTMISGGGAPNITFNIFNSSSSGLFLSVYGMVGYLLPLLTMGLVSREFSVGSVSLLYSSPMSMRQIILGKFTAMMMMGLIFCGILVIYIITGQILVKDFDLASVLPGLLGMFLMVCVYSAIGIFISSLTSYQIVAALGTYAVTILLGGIGLYGQNTAFVRDITQWLSINSRLSDMSAGMISSEIISYFIFIPAMFLSFAVIRLRNKQANRRWTGGLVRYLGVVAVVVCVAFVTSRPKMQFYYDSTRTKMLTLTKASQDILNRIDGEVRMTTYVNLLDYYGVQGYPRNYMANKKNMEQFTRFKPDIKLDYVYYYDTPEGGSSGVYSRYPDLDNYRDIAKRTALIENLDFDMFLDPEQIKNKIDLSPENNRYTSYFSRDNGQMSIMRYYWDSGSRMPGEMDVSTAMRRFLQPDVKVGFLSTGRPIDNVSQFDYYMFANMKAHRHSLINVGFQPEVVTLAGGQKIPGNIDILVVADLKGPLTFREEEEIRRFMDNGGNMIIACEPAKQQFMNPIVAPLGLAFGEGRIVQNHRDEEYPQNLVLANYTSQTKINQTEYSVNQAYAPNVTMPDAVEILKISDSGFDMEVILATDPSATCWREMQTSDFTDGKTASFDPATEEKGVFNLAAGMSREIGGKTQKIIVLGDADCIATEELNRNRGFVVSSNFALVYEMFRWLTDGQYPLNIARELGPDYLIDINYASNRMLRILFMAILPALLLAAGIVIMVRRKSK